jgi:hypothetical protein
MTIDDFLFLMFDLLASQMLVATCFPNQLAARAFAGGKF